MEVFTIIKEELYDTVAKIGRQKMKKNFRF